MKIPISRALLMSGAVETVIHSMRDAEVLPVPFELSIHVDPVDDEVYVVSRDSHAQTTLDILGMAVMVQDYMGRV